MRAMIAALTLAFALGGFATTASAGEGCDYGGHAVKKNDLETPPPATLPQSKLKTT